MKTFGRLAIIFAILTALVYASAAAHADVGGQVPGPGVCDTPDIGDSGMIGEGVAAEYWYWCDGPTEINFSHRHCEFFGAAALFTGGIQVFVQLAVSAPLGALAGSCRYRCPNNALAKEAMPDPPEAWLLGRPMGHGKCESVGDPLPVPNIPVPDADNARTPGEVGAGPGGPNAEVHR